MTTPHMSGQTADGAHTDVNSDAHLSPSDLLSDDGGIDRSKIAEVTNACESSHEVSESECRAMRVLLATDEFSLLELANKIDRGRATVRKHIHDHCGHDHDTPPVEHDNETGWSAVELRDRDELEPSDLLNEDGSVSVSAVQSLRSGMQSDTGIVMPDECRTWREEVRGASNALEAADTERAKKTVLTHVRGECSCDVAAPPLMWQSETQKRGEWVVRDE